MSFEGSKEKRRKTLNKSSTLPDNLPDLEVSLASQSSTLPDNVPDLRESLPSQESTVPDSFSESEESRIQLFNSLFRSEESLNVHFAWRRCNIEEGNLQAIQFSHCTGRMENGIVKTVM